MLLVTNGAVIGGAREFISVVSGAVIGGSRSSHLLLVTSEQ